MKHPEFRMWDKIHRDNPFNVTITEKINGTNSCIIIDDGAVIGVQSRKRLITPDDDNYGFAQWVYDNEDDIVTMGDGYHYGEWAGDKIQKNPHNLTGRHLFLFNTLRWNSENPNRPDCCDVVPVLYDGVLTPDLIDSELTKLKARTTETAEGIVIYYHAFKKYTKHTIIAPKGKRAVGL